MLVPLQITFHGVDHSDAAEANIRAAVAKLEKINKQISACRVAVEGRNHEPETHRVAFRVRIDVTLPGSELVVTEEPAPGQPHDLSGATRKAFATMERRLKNHRERKRN